MMSRTLLKWQVAVLAVGTAFSWTVLLFNYRAFFASGGRVVELSGCAVTNPIMTPCFYGALAFFIAFIWAIAILRSAPDAAPGRERGLQWLLIAGTLFAWGNLGYETYRFLQPHPGAVRLQLPDGRDRAQSADDIVLLRGDAVPRGARGFDIDPARPALKGAVSAAVSGKSLSRAKLSRTRHAAVNFAAQSLRSFPPTRSDP